MKKYPDFTDDQKTLMRQIAADQNYRTNAGGVAWKKALNEHPEWREALLTRDNRPEYILWHMSRHLRNGNVPDRPYYKTHYKSKKRAVKLEVVKRPYTKKKRWPGIEAMQRRRAELKAEREAEAASGTAVRVGTSELKLPMTMVSYCPHCGSHRSHFGNQA